MRWEEIHDAIVMERSNQIAKYGKRCIGGAESTWLKDAMILTEEFGEVLQAINKFHDAPQESTGWDVRNELIQLAACCVGILERLP